MKFFIFIEFDTKINKLYTILILLSAFPIAILFTAGSADHPHMNSGNDFFSNLLVIKLFRLWNIIRFVKKFKEMLIFMDIQAMILLKFIENFSIIILSKHISACLWMFVSKNEPHGGIYL